MSWLTRRELNSDADRSGLKYGGGSSVRCIDYTSRLHIHASRVQRLMTVQEVLLEYTLVIIVLGCYFVVSLSIKLFGDCESSFSLGNRCSF